MKKETNKIAFHDARYEDYSGKKRFEVTHPSHKRRLIVAAPDDASAIVAAADKWGERWTAYSFYAYCLVNEVRPTQKAAGR